MCYKGKVNTGLDGVGKGTLGALVSELLCDGVITKCEPDKARREGGSYL